MVRLQAQRGVQGRHAAIVGPLDIPLAVLLHEERVVLQVRAGGKHRRHAAPRDGGGFQGLAPFLEVPMGAVAVALVPLPPGPGLQQRAAQERSLVEPGLFRAQGLQAVQGLVQAPLVEGQERFQVGGRGHIRAPGPAQEAEGGIPQGALHLPQAGLPLVLRGDALRLQQLVPVPLAQGEAQRVGHAGRPVARVPGHLQVLPRLLRVIQRPVAPAQGIVAGAVGDGAGPGHVRLELRHLVPHRLEVRPDVVGRRQGRVAGQGVDAGRSLGELLGEALPAASVAPRLHRHAEGHQHRQRSHGAHGRQLPVLAELPLDAVPEPRGPGQHRIPRQEAVEVVREGAGGFVAAGALLLQALEGDGLQVPGDVQAGPPQGRDLLGGDGAQDLQGIGPAHRRPAGDHLVERGPQAVDVRAAVQPRDLAPGLLRGHVRRRAQHGARLGQVLVPVPRQAEVHDEGAQGAVLRALDHDVGGLEVPVDDPHPVGLLDAQGRIPHRHHPLLQGQLHRRRVEGLAADALHGDEDPALHLAHFEDLAHMVVVHPGLGPGLQHEAREVAVVVEAHELDGHHAAQAPVAAAEHLAHAALPQEAQALVAVPARHRELRHAGSARRTGRIRERRPGPRGPFPAGQGLGPGQRRIQVTRLRIFFHLLCSQGREVGFGDRYPETDHGTV